jgi:uncharacterized repeat protein (TIGR01451 family)
MKTTSSALPAFASTVSHTRHIAGRRPKTSRRIYLSMVYAVLFWLGGPRTALSIIVSGSATGSIEYYTGFLGGPPGGCRFPFETRWGDACLPDGLRPIPPQGLTLLFNFIPGFQDLNGDESRGETALTFKSSATSYGIFIPQPTTLTQKDPLNISLLPAVIRINFIVNLNIGGKKETIGLPKHVDTYSYPIVGTVPPVAPGKIPAHFIGVAVGGLVTYFVNGQPIPAPSSTIFVGPGNIPFTQVAASPFAVVLRGRDAITVPDIKAPGVLTIIGTLIFAVGGDDGADMEMDTQVMPGLMTPIQLSLPPNPQPNISGNGFHFILAGDASRFYLTESSSNLVDWTPLQTVQLASNRMEIVDSQNAGQARYYRAQLLPGGTGGTPPVVMPVCGTHGSLMPSTNFSCISGTNITFTAVADTNYVVAQWQVNNVEVTNGVSSFTLTNIQADASVYVTFQPANDLAVTLTPPPALSVISNDLAYTMIVTNSGVNTSHNVMASNSLPDGVALVSANASQGSCSSGNGYVTCALGDLPAGAAATVTIVVSPTVPGTLTVLVSVWGDEFEPVTNNNYDTTTTVALQVPTITGQPLSQSVPTGSNVSFSVTATNAMPLITNWVLTDIEVVPQTNSPGTLTYQWLFYGTNLPAATNALLTVPNVGLSNAGPYAVVVSNAATNATSVTASLTVKTTNCLPDPSGIVSWWPGDGTAADITGTNNGILMDGTSFGTGEVGQAFRLDGVANYVLIPNSATLNPTGPFSIETWIQASSAQSSVQFLIVDKSHGWTDGTGWALQGNPDGTVAFSYGIGGNSGSPANFPYVSTSSSVLDDQWHHLAGVFTGTQIQIYLDGVVQQTLDQTNLPANNQRDVEIGRSWGGGTPTGYFHGLIDEVTYYNQALAPADIFAIYNAAAAGKCK